MSVLICRYQDRTIQVLSRLSRNVFEGIESYIPGSTAAQYPEFRVFQSFSSAASYAGQQYLYDYVYVDNHQRARLTRAIRRITIRDSVPENLKMNLNALDGALGHPNRIVRRIVNDPGADVDLRAFDFVFGGDRSDTEETFPADPVEDLEQFRMNVEKTTDASGFAHSSVTSRELNRQLRAVQVVRLREHKTFLNGMFGE